MEAVDRISNHHDWITFILLGVFLMLFVLHFLDRERLRQLISTPFNSFYFSNYESENDSLFKGFNLLLFISSNLVFSLFLYILFQNYALDRFKITNHFYLTILISLLLYWVLKILMETVLFWLFDIGSLYKKMLHVKMTYFYSISFYVLFFVLFGVYYFDWHGNYIRIVSVFIVILLIIRYYNFVILSQRSGVFSLFYFILYLCTLEIAPLLIVLKWNMTR